MAHDMKLENIDNLRGLISKLDELHRELDIWTTKITKISALGYFSSPSQHGTRLDSRMDKEIFIKFRSEVISNLQSKIIEIKNQIGDL